MQLICFAPVKVAQNVRFNFNGLRQEELRGTLKALGLVEGPLAEHFCLPLDRFEVNGPNGRHYAFVYPVLGPCVSRLLHVEMSQEHGKVMRQLSLQVTKAMAALHKRDI